MASGGRMHLNVQMHTRYAMDKMAAAAAAASHIGHSQSIRNSEQQKRVKFLCLIDIRKLKIENIISNLKSA